MKHIVAVDNVIVKRVGDEAVILNLDTETYYSLNTTGIRMWEVATTTATLDEAARILSNEYKLPVETIAADLDELIQKLQTARLVEVDE